MTMCHFNQIENFEGCNVNYMRVIKRDEPLAVSDVLAGDPPNLTSEERRHPVKVELIRPVEIAGEKRDFVIVKPTTFKQFRRFGLSKGSIDKHLFPIICECTSLSKKVVSSMLPADFDKLKRLLLEFNRNHLPKLQKLKRVQFNQSRRKRF